MGESPISSKGFATDRQYMTESDHDEDMPATPAVKTRRSRTSGGIQQQDDRTPAQTHVRPDSDAGSPSQQAKTPIHKKYRSGIHDDRRRQQTHSRPESDVDSPVQPVNDPKRARGDDDMGMGSTRTEATSRYSPLSSEESTSLKCTHHSAW